MTDHRKRRATFGRELYDRRVTRSIERIRICQPAAVREQRIDEFIAAVLARSKARILRD